MAKIVKPVTEDLPPATASLDEADAAAATLTRGLGAARRRIEELVEALAQSERARKVAEARAGALEEKLRKITAELG